MREDAHAAKDVGFGKSPKGEDFNVESGTVADWLIFDWIISVFKIVNNFPRLSNECNNKSILRYNETVI